MIHFIYLLLIINDYMVCFNHQLSQTHTQEVVSKIIRISELFHLTNCNLQLVSNYLSNETLTFNKFLVTFTQQNHSEVCFFFLI